MKIKVNAERKARESFSQVAIEPYGGGLWHTWFDRDLGLAGRLLLQASDNAALLEERLVLLDKPILRIPSLAIHLDRSADGNFKYNAETHLQAISGMLSPDGKTFLERILSIDNGVSAPCFSILAHELCLFDTQAAQLAGLNGEFVVGARLDNLASTFAALDAACTLDPSHFNPDTINVIAMFDDEEVGSRTLSGASSNFLPGILGRILSALGFEGGINRAESICISADMAHAVHPNYSDAHDEGHRPQIGRGLVLKHNSNGRYCSSARPAARIRSLCQSHGIPFQEFMVRNDSPCGSTIGPMLSSALGIDSVDLGIGQLAMHSIREICSTEDLCLYIRFFSLLLQQHSLPPIKAFLD